MFTKILQMPSFTRPDGFIIASTGSEVILLILLGVLDMFSYMYLYNKKHTKNIYVFSGATSFCICRALVSIPITLSGPCGPFPCLGIELMSKMCDLIAYVLNYFTFCFFEWFRKLLNPL